MRKIAPLLIFTFFVLGLKAQQITGNNPAIINTTNNVYTFPAQAVVGAPSWVISSNGTILSTTTGSTNTATVKWTALGTGTLSFKDGSITRSTITVSIVGVPPVAQPATAVTATSFTANWSSVSGATGYRLDVSTSSSFSSFVTGYNDLAVSTLSSSVTGLTGGTTYYYRVRAVTSSGTSGNSATITQLTLPSAPVLSSYTNITTTSLTINWGSVLSATGYRVDVSLSSAFGSFINGYNNLSVSGTTCPVSGLSAGTTYYVRVRAVNATGTSLNVWGNAPTLTIAPVATSASAVTDSGLTANWNAVTGATSYVIDVSTNSAFSSFVGAYNNFPVAGTNCSVTGLVWSVSYYYRVRAVDASGVSAVSNTIAVTTTAPTPSAPTASSITATSFVASWQAVPNADSYLIDVFKDIQFTQMVVLGQPVSGTSQIISHLDANTNYYFRIRAVNTAGTTPNSGTATVLTSPLPPTMLDGKYITASSFTAFWTSVQGATQYQLDVSTDNFSTFVSGYHNLIVTDITKVISGLTLKTSYYVRVRAYNGTLSDYSNTVRTSLDHNFVQTTTVTVAGKTTGPMVDNATIQERSVTTEYFDGIGRHNQSVTLQGSPSQKDIVHPAAYDAFGREPKNYLPYTDGADGWYKENALKDPTTTLTDQQAVYRTGQQYQFYQAGAALATDQFPYAETRFDASPLNRTIKQGAAGSAWQPDANDTYSSADYTIKRAYEYNGPNEVLNFDYIYPDAVTYTMGFIKIGKTVYYPANQLHRNRTKDEQGNEVIEYVNKDGHTILKKVQATLTTYAQTYYIYDDFGNLVYVLQPEATQAIINALPITWSNKASSLLSDATTNTLSRPSGGGYGTTSTNTAGATSSPTTEKLASGVDGWVETIANENNKSRMIGFITTTTRAVGSNIPWAIELHKKGKIYAWENNVKVDSFGIYSTNTVVRLSCESGAIKYYVDGVLKRTSPTLSTGTLMVDVSFDDAGGTLQYVNTSFRLNASLTGILNNYAFRYTYDLRKRMSQKQVPGADPVYMVYDCRDRLVLTQDGNQRAGAANTIKYWSFTKYDAFNRPILTGIKDTTISTATVMFSQADMQGVVDNFYKKNGAVYYETMPGSIHGYTNKSYPVLTTGSLTDPNSYLTATYYDNYSVIATWPASHLYMNQSAWKDAYTYLNESLSLTENLVLYSQPVNENQNVVGHPTVTKVKVLDGGVTGGFTWLKTVSYYDDKYRVVQTLSDNYKGGVDRISNVYDFAGKLLETKFTHNENDVTWRDQSGVALIGNKLVKTATTAAWTNSGAASVQQLPAGQDGWVELIVSEINTARMIGLASANPDLNYTSINYALYLNSKNLAVYESGSQKQLFSNYINSGDVLRIERIGTAVKYFKNGTEIYPAGATVTQTPSNTLLMVDVSLYTANATLAGVRTSFSNTSHTITRHFDYDHMGRMLNTWHKLDAQPDYLLASNKYNELGQLIDKKLHSINSNASDAKQSIDYRYNIRGWLTSMNNSQLTNDGGTTNDDAGDFFGMNLLYEKNDTNLGSTGLFNGNISGMKWSSNLGLSAIKETGYNFSYDAMSRLTAANSRVNNTNIWQTGNYDEIISLYDLNGNIKNLQRKGDGGAQIDNLTYNYGTGTAVSNKLLYVQDAGTAKGFTDGNGGTVTDYSYDVNGNLTRDLNKGIGSTITDANNKITYNFLNLPELITKSGTSATTTSSVRYIYDATGHKLSQVVTFINAQKQTDYVGEYVYENDALQFISHEEGRITMAGTKLIYTNTCDNVTSDMTAVNSTLAAAAINGEKYVSATATATTAGTGIFPVGGTFNVQPGETYRVRAKGYRGTSIAYLQVKAGATVLNAPGAEFPNNSKTESWVEQIVTIPAGVTTLQAGIVWSTVTAGEIIYLNEIEIDLLTNTSATPEYQYNLKDHIGNVRLTFTTRNDVDTATGTFEPANATTERGKFLRYDNARIVNYYIFDHTNGSAPTTNNGAAQRLNGQGNEIYGLARSLSVMPGDVIDMEVYAKYIDSNSGHRTVPLNTLVTQIATGTAPAGTVVDGGGYTTSTSSFPFPGGQNGTPSSTGVGPKAYLNWLVFDRNQNLILSKSGYMRMDTTARETGQDVAHQRLYGSITIADAGYVYIYVSNEEGANAYECYFDDLKVTQTKSPIVQMDDYYPFGLVFNNYSRENTVQNKYLFNGESELQSDLDFGVYSTLFRTYDPALGRFSQIDPLADFFAAINPYAFANDNPVLYSDPDGLTPWWLLNFRRKTKQFWYDITGRGNKHAIIYGREPGSKFKTEIGAKTHGRNRKPNPRLRDYSITKVDFANSEDKIQIPTFHIPEPEPEPEPKSEPEPEPDPIYKGKVIPENKSISFSENLTFQANSDHLDNTQQNQKIINDLVKALKDYPQLELFIVGNAGTAKPGQVKYYGNSQQALNQGGYENGVYMTFGGLMTSRAKAVYQALINAGISPGRLHYGPGVLYPTPNGRKTTFVLKN